jgi:hypothetical protein
MRLWAGGAVAASRGVRQPLANRQRALRLCAWCTKPLYCELQRQPALHRPLHQPLPASSPRPPCPRCRRKDEARIKDLSQRIEKVTRQVAQRKEDLEREITDTQVGGLPAGGAGVVAGCAEGGGGGGGGGGALAPACASPVDGC